MELVAWLGQEVPTNPWEWVFYGGGVGSLALVAWLLGTGRLIPRSTLLDERAACSARIAADAEAHRTELAQRDETIDRLIGERNRFVELAVRSTSAAEKTSAVLDTAGLERVAQDAAMEALRRAAGKDGP